MKSVVKQSLHFHPQLIISQREPKLEELLKWAETHFKISPVLASQVWEVGNDAKNNIAKAEILKLMEWAELKSDDGNLKVCIIWHAELLSNISQNSLLKFIEEPPNEVLVLISAKTNSNLLKTLRSRAAEVRWKQNENKEIGNIDRAEKYLAGNYLDKVKMVEKWEREQFQELMGELQISPAALEKDAAAVAKATAALKHNASPKLTSLYLAISMSDKN